MIIFNTKLIYQIKEINLFLIINKYSLLENIYTKINKIRIKDIKKSILDKF